MNITEITKRIEALPPAKAREYLAELDRLTTRAAEGDWSRFEFRLRRAEWLAGQRHHSPVRPL